MILEGGKEVKIIQHQIVAVWQTFQGCPPKHCKSCVAVTTWGWALLHRSKTPVVSIPGRCGLMAAHNCFRVAGCTVWCCIDCCALFHEIHQQYTLVVPKHHNHHFTSRFAHLEFFQSQVHRVFPLHACTFFSGEWWWTHVWSPVTMYWK